MEHARRIKFGSGDLRRSRLVSCRNTSGGLRRSTRMREHWSAISLNDRLGWREDACVLVGQEFAFTAAHERRHLWQAWRVRKKLLSIGIAA